MLFAVVLGIMLGVVGTTLLRQWLQGALVEAAPGPELSASEFPRLAPPSRTRRPSPRLVGRSVAHSAHTLTTSRRAA